MTYEIEHVNLIPGDIPDDYHCTCDFCKEYGGLLIREDGTKYSKFERNKYYDKAAEKAHIAKTPLHCARWAIQEYSKEDDWVLDPTMGAGTTAVESLMQKRNVAGVELQFIDVIFANTAKCNPHDKKFIIKHGDARELLNYFPEAEFDLIVNNPPYSGDENQAGIGTGKHNKYNHALDKNLAFLKENKDYWETMTDIYIQAAMTLKKGGRFVIGVKDMIRQKAPYLLHKYYGECLLKAGLTFKQMVLLPHWPPTLFMSTYNKRFPEVKVPRYQTILVFQK